MKNFMMLIAGLGLGLGAAISNAGTIDACELCEIKSVQCMQSGGGFLKCMREFDACKRANNCRD